MKRRKTVWLVAIIIPLCFVVPYTLLRNVDAWYGSMLFWTLATLAVIGINAIVSSAWRDDQ